MSPPTAIQSEAELIDAVRRGSRDAFAQVVRQHQGAVYAYLRARLLEPADAEDLCQEVFLRCYAGRAGLSRAVAMGPWLVGIGRNVLREHVRRMQRRKEIAWTELCLEMEALVETVESDREDALAFLPGCLDSLGKSAREALDLHYHANLKLAEIGERLHRSVGAVKLLMYRARQALKQCLDLRMRGSGDE